MPLKKLRDITWIYIHIAIQDHTTNTYKILMYISVSTTILFLGIYPKEIDKAHMFIQKAVQCKTVHNYKYLEIISVPIKRRPVR